MDNSIKVFAPATVSNVGSGFDTVGFAIYNLGDEVILKPNKKNIVRVTKITGDKNQLPLNSEDNTCSVAILHMLKALGSDQGFDIEIRKKMPICSGLGSSAASAVGGAFALNEITGRPFNDTELVEYAMKGEFIASRSFHADNIAPCMLGGFILIRDYNPLDLLKINAPSNLFCTILLPELKINTAEARKLLKNKIELKKARAHFGNIGALIAGLYEKDINMIGKSTVDLIAEPYRSKLIPGYDEIKQAALDNGAAGCNISGSGPAIFAFSSNEETAAKIGKEMKKVIDKYEIKGKYYVSKVNNTGAKVAE